MAIRNNEKLPGLLHLIINTNLYGYNRGISTTDAVVKLEQYIQKGSDSAKILLMGPAKAFGAINGTKLWTELYKKGLNMETIIHLRKGRNKQKYQKN